MGRKFAEFASKLAAYMCIIGGLPTAFSLFKNEPLTYIVMAGGVLMFLGGCYWLRSLHRKYG